MAANDVKTGQDLVKLSANVSPEVVDVVQSLAKKRSTSGAEVIRQAISTEQYFDKVRAEGGEILVRNKSGEIERIVFKP
jgi:hypothetical protein